MADPVETARGYYRALDTHSYDDLTDLLHAEFTQYRPDRTLAGRDRFVRFMREQRPTADTTHDVSTILTTDDGTGVAARGRLLDADGEEMIEFVDVHEFSDDGTIATIRTYTR